MASPAFPFLDEENRIHNICREHKRKMAANIDSTAGTQGLRLFSVLRKTTSDFKKYLHLTELLEEELDEQDNRVAEPTETEHHRSGGRPIGFKVMEQGDSSESQQTLQGRIPIHATRSSAYCTVGGSEDTESSVTDFNSVSSYGSITGTTSVSSIYLRGAASSKLNGAVGRRGNEESSTISDAVYSHCSSESTNDSDNLAYQAPRNIKTQRMQKRFAREAGPAISDSSNGEALDNKAPLSNKNRYASSSIIGPTTVARKYDTFRSQNRQVLKAKATSFDQVKGDELMPSQVAPHVPAGTRNHEIVEEKVQQSEAPAKYLPFSNFFFGNANAEESAVKQSDGSDSKEIQNPKLHIDVSAQCVSPLLPYSGAAGTEGKCQYAHRPRIHTQEAETQLDDGSLTDIRDNDVPDNFLSERLERG